MDTKHNAVLYMIKKYGPLESRMIRYITYLVDRELYRRYGHSLFKWKLYKYGPVSSELYKVLDELWMGDLVDRRIVDYGVVYEYVGSGSVEIPVEVKEVIDYVMGVTSVMTDDEIIEYVFKIDNLHNRIPGEVIIG